MHGLQFKILAVIRFYYQAPRWKTYLLILTTPNSLYRFNKRSYFQYRPINPSGCVTLLLTATIDSLSKSCPRPIGIGHGVLNIFYGSVCGNIITRPDSACEDRLDTFGYDVYKTFLQLTNTDKVRDSVSICNGGLMIDSITIHSGNLAQFLTQLLVYPQPGCI